MPLWPDLPLFRDYSTYVSIFLHKILWSLHLRAEGFQKGYERLSSVASHTFSVLWVDSALEWHLARPYYFNVLWPYSKNHGVTNAASHNNASPNPSRDLLETSRSVRKTGSQISAYIDRDRGPWYLWMCLTRRRRRPDTLFIDSADQNRSNLRERCPREYPTNHASHRRLNQIWQC